MEAAIHVRANNDGFAGLLAPTYRTCRLVSRSLILAADSGYLPIRKLIIIWPSADQFVSVMSRLTLIFIASFMVIIRTPLRVSFLGGGTDHPMWFRQHGGAVLSTSINKYVYLQMRRLPSIFDYNYRVVWRIVEQAKD